MNKIRITKEFGFEMAHALWNYDGPCKNIHGHSYKLAVTIIGSVIDDISNPKNGMVIDFKDFKKLIHEKIILIFDHGVVLSKSSNFENLLEIQQMFEKCVIVDYQPTCENLIIDFVDRIKQNLPSNVTLFSLKLNETSNSYAEWFSVDND